MSMIPQGVPGNACSARRQVKAKSSGEPGCPVALEDLKQGAGSGNEERFYVTRAELISLVDEALKARGVAG